jgi:2-C-methyl-D-erythritol 2,4-cyclodiphosphate synthase
LTVDRVGIGYDLHRLAPGRALMLGTIEVPHTFGLLGHSDGDVLAHAIADALLGASGLGEIGAIFPDSDPRWKGLRGADLLAQVASRLRDGGWKIGNVDSVVIAERPRLAPHQAAMRDGLAAALGVGAALVSVKIKSNEGCGAIGRGEAIAAQAVARVTRE